MHPFGYVSMMNAQRALSRSRLLQIKKVGASD